MIPKKENNIKQDKIFNIYLIIPSICYMIIKLTILNIKFNSYCKKLYNILKKKLNFSKFKFISYHVKICKCCKC